MSKNYVFQHIQCLYRPLTTLS